MHWSRDRASEFEWKDFGQFFERESSRDGYHTVVMEIKMTKIGMNGRLSTACALPQACLMVNSISLIESDRISDRFFMMIDKKSVIASMTAKGSTLNATLLPLKRRINDVRKFIVDTSLALFLMQLPGVLPFSHGCRWNTYSAICSPPAAVVKW